MTTPAHPRRLAGSRRNKHQPVARAVHLSDIRLDGWPMTWSPPAEHGRPADHAARAVDIDACFGARLPERDHPVGSGVSSHATPMEPARRRQVYAAQNGVYRFTPRQRRRDAQKVPPLWGDEA